MSLSCPNKKLKIWKDLVQKVGENKAYLLWAEYDGNVSESYYNILNNNIENKEKVNIKNLEGSKKNKLDYYDREGTQQVIEDRIDDSARNTYVLFGNQQGKITVDEILENILNNYDNLSPEGKELLQKARRLVGRHGAKFKFVSESALTDQYTVMQINSDTNTIEANRQRLNQFSTDEVVETFLHELAHAQTLQALLNPQSFEEKEFKKLVDEMYSKYKSLSNLSKSYGFTNEKEFVSEIYANKAFREEIKALDKENNTSYWKKFINAIRRLFGLSKSKESDLLIEQVIDFVEQDRRDYRGTNLQRLLFAKKIDYKKDELLNVEEKLNKTLDKIKDNLDNLLKRSETYKRKNEEKGSKFKEHIEKLISEVNTAEKISQWKSITVYLNSMSKVVKDLNKRLDSEDLTKENGLELIDSFKNYLSSYDLINSVENLIADLESDKINEIGREDIDELTQTLTDIKGKHSFLENRFNTKLRNILTTQLNDIHYLPTVEEEWINKLNKEYKDRGITGISQTEWVTQQMNGVRKDEIQVDVDNEINRLIKGIGTDISNASATLLDGINNNSRLVGIATKLIISARNKIITKTLDGDFIEKDLHERLIKEKGNISNQKKLYENILDFDSEGNGYYKGNYSIKFYEQVDKLLNARKDASEKFGKPSKEYTEANKKYRQFINANTIVKNKVRKPIDKWKTDFSKLSDTEKDVLNYFISTVEKTDEQTYGIQSLIKYAGGAKFYKLPSVTKSDQERLLEGNTKGFVKDKIKDFTSIRPDDIGFEERRVNSKNEVIYSQKVHYRGNIEPNQQSYDLFTISRLNRINGINYEEKHNIALQLEAIKQISKSKEYYARTTGGVPILNAFGNRQKSVTIEGVHSNEYKMLSSIVEKNLYDILHINYGTLGPVDINKAVNTFNSWTATVGLSLNTFSAAANILNAQSQIFLEKIAGNHITKGAVTEAHKYYTKDLPNIIRDYNSPIKTSFTNQVNQMFDTFGGFTVKQQEFLKNSIAKTSLTKESLQVLHEGGEHYAQSVMVMATLASIKVMNANNEFIDKEGNVVTEDKAANLLQMLYKDNDGRLRISDKVVFSTRNLTTKMNEGGKDQILLFVKKKINDTMGNFDPNFQNELYRHWYGKLFMLFRRYLIPQLITRYRGISTAFVKEEDLTEDDIHFNDALRASEEGSYVSLLRFLANSVRELKQLKFDVLSSNWNDLSNDKKANIRKAITEIALTSTLLPLLALFAAGGADGDDDWLWTVAFLARRLESELSQFRDPREATKITKSPIPSLRMIEIILNTLDYLLPWNWSEINDRFESGKNKGELKIVNQFEKLTGINKFDNKSKELYNYLDSTWGK